MLNYVWVEVTGASLKHGLLLILVEDEGCRMGLIDLRRIDSLFGVNGRVEIRVYSSSGHIFEIFNNKI